MGDVEAENLKKILTVLKSTDVSETKIFALECLLGLTGSDEGLETIYKNGAAICQILCDLTFDKDDNVAQKSCSILINLSAEEKGANLLTSTELSVSRPTSNIICKQNAENSVISVLLEHTLNIDTIANETCMILANISRNADNARKIYDSFERPDDAIETIVRLLLKKHDNVNLDYLASLLSNLSQLPEVRNVFLDPGKDLLQKIFPLVEQKNSIRRRFGIVGTIRNLCLSSNNHEWMLSSEVDLLPRVLLPLAGPEEFDDEDNEKLPLDLQYLPDDKTREPEAEIRKMLLEILMQLSSTRSTREILRNFNVYVILRELHKWETDHECLATCEDLVNILIRTEDEIGADNLLKVDIPEHLTEKFNES
ncbi:protein HGH1 homolog [Planococcus citri]|uniref:protein HGH1 homolog n=1 Tax=Planococcus citri TaxID=170843 RepID=UPI0031F95703